MNKKLRNGTLQTLRKYYETNKAGQYALHNIFMLLVFVLLDDIIFDIVNYFSDLKGLEKIENIESWVTFFLVIIPFSISIVLSKKVKDFVMYTKIDDPS